MDSSVLQVVIFRDGTLVGTEVFLAGEYTIGSDAGCELVLPDDSVQRCHAVLSFKGGVISVSDAGGGLAVNGQSLTQAEVTARDDVVVGFFLFKFRPVAQKKPAVGAPAKPAPAPAQWQRSSSSFSRAHSKPACSGVTASSAKARHPSANAGSFRDVQARASAIPLRSAQSKPALCELQRSSRQA